MASPCYQRGVVDSRLGRATDMPAASDSPQPRVVILGTGGTIAAAATASTNTTDYALALGIEAVLAAVPEMQSYARVSAEQVVNLPSQEVDNTTLLPLARRINALLASDDVDGVVVTHGTDTMEETAYFLNLVVKSIKPVVVVGAMRPSTALSADGRLNLLNAVKVAAAPHATGKGVLIVLNDRIGAARLTVKTHTTAIDAFSALESGFIGTVIGANVDFHAQVLRAHTIHTEFNVASIATLPQVDIVYGYQNAGRYLIDAAIDAGAKGIIYAATGNGTLSEAAKRGAASAREHGVVFVRSTRVGGGSVTPHRVDAELGTVGANSLNPQKARILLSLTLTLTSDSQRVQTYFDRY